MNTTQNNTVSGSFVLAPLTEKEEKSLHHAFSILHSVLCNRGEALADLDNLDPDGLKILAIRAVRDLGSIAESKFRQTMAPTLAKLEPVFSQRIADYQTAKNALAALPDAVKALVGDKFPKACEVELSDNAVRACFTAGTPVSLIASSLTRCGYTVQVARGRVAEGKEKGYSVILTPAAK